MRTKRTVFLSLLLAALLALACFAGFAGCSSDEEEDPSGDGGSTGELLSYDPSVYNVEWLGMVTGPESANRTDEGYYVGGTDLGIPAYNATDGNMYLFYGDTFQTASTQQGLWRSNVVAYSDDFDLSDGLTLDGFLTGGGRMASAVIDGHHADRYEMTKIPTGAIEIDGTFYMFYFSIRQWGPEEMNYCGAVKSTDNGQTWERVFDMTWVDHAEGGYSTDIQVLVNEGVNWYDESENTGTVDITEHVGNNFTQIYPVDGKDGYIYILGEGEYRSSGIRLGRVLKENIEVFEEYEYFKGYGDDGEPVWLKGSEGLAEVEADNGSFIISDQCGEQSCMYNEYLDKWMVVYLVNNADGIVYRTADNIWGPYSEPKVLIPYSYPFENGINSIYGGFVHELYTEQDGKIFYMQLSQWTPVYNTSLVKVTLV